MRVLILFLINFSFISSFAQSTISTACLLDTSYKTKITNLSYPFNEAKRILVVSYKAIAIQGKPNFFSWDTVQIIPKKESIVDTTRFIYKHELTKDGRDSLFKIINQGSKDNFSVEGIFIEPSNAILFIDKNNRIFEYIVICFAQTGNYIHYTTMTSSPKSSLGKWCEERGLKLLSFFQQEEIIPIVTKW